MKLNAGIGEEEWEVLHPFFQRLMDRERTKPLDDFLWLVSLFLAAVSWLTGRVSGP